MDQVKFVEDSLWKIWSDKVYLNFLKAVLHNIYLVRSWIPWPIYRNINAVAKIMNEENLRHYPIFDSYPFLYPLKTSEMTSNCCTATIHDQP